MKARRFTEEQIIGVLKEVVGWPIQPRMTTGIVMNALTMAWFRRKRAVGPVHHSAQESQYASHAFRRAAETLRHGLLDESQRKLLGQRADREFLQQFEERTGTWH